MSSLRRPVQRTMTASRSRLMPRVDFISIQREVSEGAKMSRVLRLGGRGAAKPVANFQMSSSPDSAPRESTTKLNQTHANQFQATQEVSTVMLTPALRLSFAIDHPAC